MRTVIAGLYAAALAAWLAAFGLTACGNPGTSTTVTVTVTPPSPTFTALTLPAACRVLRTNILANGGTPDRATLQQVIDHASSAYLVIDAKAARRDLGDSMAMGFDLAFMQRDCRRTGVQIPTTGSV
jgi:hypothetical protein